MSGRYEQAVAGGTFSPVSLVGSYFRGAGPDLGADQWQGAVVAEPAPGTYLVELDTGGQRLVPIADMVSAGWTFYDEMSDAGQ